MFVLINIHSLRLVACIKLNEIIVVSIDSILVGIVHLSSGGRTDKRVAVEHSAGVYYLCVLFVVVVVDVVGVGVVCMDLFMCFMYLEGWRWYNYVVYWWLI